MDAMTNSHITLETWTRWLGQLHEQPPWRARADREMDYYDGNQLDADVLRRQRELGIPPAIEPLIKPTIDSLLGMEVKQRADWKVVPDDDEQDDEVAEALNHKLNRAERHARADAACSEAFKHQVCVGMGWVEVAREADPFHFSYRCRSIHRNEIFWDFLAKEPDLSDARYLIRRKWIDVDQAQLMFPQHAEMLGCVCGGWNGIDWDFLTLDGGSVPALATAWQQERGWSIEEQEWRDVEKRRLCLFECWYREWVRAQILKTQDGRVVEFDQNNPEHIDALYNGGATLDEAVVSKVRLSWWCGPHLLSDEPTPYQHRHFPYVPFWGFREDRTNVPYGLVRGMTFLQDEVNARISKMQWLLSARATIRTDGAVMQDDEEFRQMVARPDADIILDQTHMGLPGARFELVRNFELSQQQFDRLQDARDGLKRVSGITANFEGAAEGNNQSGLAVNSLIEQSVQAVTDMLDNFSFSRMMVGDILLSLIVQDSQDEERVVVPGTVVKEDKEVVLNLPQYDAAGNGYLTNDVQRAKLKVTLEDVPSTPSFRAQQLAAMSEAFKSMPQRYQEATMPFLFALMDVPNKAEVMDVIKRLSQLPTEEEIQQRIDEGIAKAGIEVKQREVAVKEAAEERQAAMTEAQIQKIVAEAVSRTIESIYSATQAGIQIASAPHVAPIADQLLQSAGFVDKDEPPIVAPPGMPMAPDAGAAQPKGTMSGIPGEADDMMEQVPDEYAPETNTSPMFPPRATPKQVPLPGLPDAAPPMGQPDAGLNAGIERPGPEPVPNL